MGDAATPRLPDFTSQTASQYKANIDAGFAVADRLAWAFAPHEQATPDMTLRIEAGAIFDGATLTEIAAQSTPAIAAPTTNPRIDRIVIDRATGAVSVVAGAEAATPAPPAIPAGKAPVARVSLAVGQTTIVNADITDERHLGLLGLGDAATESVAAGGVGPLLRNDGDGSGLSGIQSFPAGTRMLFQQTSAPTGWTKETGAGFNDAALRIVTGTVGGGGATGFATVFGAGKTTGGHTLSVAELAPHTGHVDSVTTTTVQAPSMSSTTRTVVTAVNTSNRGSGAAHDHTLSLDLAYKDVIVASKD